MTVRALISGLAICLAASPLMAQSPQQPSPPAQICVNGKCVATAPVAAPAASGSIKWNPGHYMASDALLFAGDTISKVQAEMDDLAGYDNIVGYRILVGWGALEPSEGQYDFSLIDSILSRLKTQYGHPKHLVLVVLPGPFGSAMPSGGTGRVIPTYLQQDSSFGPSPVSGSYGWWGQNSGGASTGPYVAALYRPAVMDRMIALVQALGARYDGDPDFEAIMFQEDAWMVGLWSGSPDFSVSGFISQLKRLLTATTAAFPHTSVIMENTWAGTLSPTQDFEQWMVANRIAPGTADTVGQSAFNMGYATSKDGLNWGLQAYMGIAPAGSDYTGGDLRPQSRAMLDIEGFDIAGNYYGNWGAPEGFKPADVLTALNSTYQASHAFWTHFFGSEQARGGGTVSAVAPWAVWSQLAPLINANPLVNTAYPRNYP